jgi:hypothetical protein
MKGIKNKIAIMEIKVEPAPPAVICATGRISKK